MSNTTTKQALWKTTVVIWSEDNPEGTPLTDLAMEAVNGSAYCSFQFCEHIKDPKADKDWDGTEFFDGGDNE